MRCFALLVALVGVIHVGAQPCGTPDVKGFRNVCNGKTYDFSCLHPANQSYFNGVDQSGEYMYYFQAINGGLPSSVGLCTFTPTFAVGNAIGQANLDGDACYPVASAADQAWSVTSDSSGAQVIAIDFTGGQEGRYATVNFVCDMSAALPEFSVVGEVDFHHYVINIRTMNACANYFGPTCGGNLNITTATSACAPLNLELMSGETISTSGIMMDVVEDGVYRMTRMDFASCDSVGSDPIFEFDALFNIKSMNNTHAILEATSFNLFLSDNATDLAFTLSKSCPCDGMFLPGQWKSESTSTCTQLPPPNAHWLCWVLSGAQLTTALRPLALGGYTRSMLEASVEGGNDPAIDSPPFLPAPLTGKTPSAGDCDYDLWNTCGADVSAAVSGCTGDFNDSFRTLCLLNALSADTITSCCPCLAKYAEINGDKWAVLPCAA